MLRLGCRAAALRRFTTPAFSHLTEEVAVLGIETSCDDTGVAVVRSDGRILGEVLVSQVELHRKFGGIKPDLAAAAHGSVLSKAVAEVISFD